MLYSAGDAAAASALIGWCRLVGDRPAGDVMDELSRLATGSASLGPFCAVVIGDHGLDVLSHGGVPLVAQTAGGKQSLTDGQTHVQAECALDLIIGDAPIDTLLALTDGVVAADGFSLRAAVASAPPWGTTAPQVSAEPMTPTDDKPESARSPAPLAAAAMISLRDTSAERRLGSAPIPLGTGPGTAARCWRRQPRCRLLALSRRQRSSPPPVVVRSRCSSRASTVLAVTSTTRGPALLRGVRHRHESGQLHPPTHRRSPAVGRARDERDGSYHTLVTSLVFGRDPDDDPEVREGRAQGVTLVDPGNTISRVHAEIRAVEWDVHIVDHGSTNGTFVWSAERQQWDRLVANQPVLLSPGSHVAFGRMTATYESNNRQKS